MKVIILRGIPGSGKSTFAKSRCPVHFAVSADDYFTKDGTYKFDGTKIAFAHQDCLARYVDILQNPEIAGGGFGEEGVLVVDNTNITAIEIAPYYALALAYGYDVHIVNFLCDPEVAASRCVHGVPEKTIRRMADQMVKEEANFAPWWRVGA